MRIFRLLGVILFFILFLGCEKNPPESTLTSSDAVLESFVKSVMTDIYYWYDKVPSGRVMDGEKDVFNFFNTLLYEKDRWSWMMTGEVWNSSETGIYLSYGASLGQPIEYYNDYALMIQYVHPNSPFDLNGVKRGWTITHIGGVDTRVLIKKGSFNAVYNLPLNTFTFKDNLGNTTVLEIRAQEISTKSYLRKQVFTSADFTGLKHPVAYFNYLTFNYPMQGEIDEAFAFFHGEGVKDIILDLRYNGGGDSSPTSLLANYLAPIAAEGRVLSRKIHNNKYSSGDKDSVVIERMDNALDIDRVFVITGPGSASASEVVINGLSPLFGKENIIQVGDTTYGKPNGMYAIPYPMGDEDIHYEKADYVFLPICFFTVNSEGVGDYLDGLPPTNYRPDDLYNDWGVEEDLIKACLTYINDGSFPELPKLSPSQKRLESGRLSIKMPEDMPGYGLYIDRLN